MGDEPKDIEPLARDPNAFQQAADPPRDGGLLKHPELLSEMTEKCESTAGAFERQREYPIQPSAIRIVAHTSEVDSPEERAGRTSADDLRGQRPQSSSS
jgi:hypothetical protein